MASFTDLGLSADLAERLAATGITEPSPVQAAALPALLAGRDARVRSQTGSGKTLAFLLPMIERLDGSSPAVQGLVIVPTQELGIQIREVARGVLTGTGIGVIALIGGANPARQAEMLRKGPQLVVGTPGRLLDFLRQGRLLLEGVAMVVVDEVDHLIDEGKQGDVEALLRAVPPSAQRAMASATFGAHAGAWADKWLREAVDAHVAAPGRMPEALEHVAIIAEKRDHGVMVRRLLRHYEPDGAIAFVGKGEAIPPLVDKLRYHHVEAAGLSGEVKKLDRARILREFREGKVQLLVSTDLAARGLDFGHVSLILNVDVPTDPEHYVHRAGRTGRMGREGLVITLIDPSQLWLLEKYEKALGITFARPVFAEGEVRERTAEDDRREARKAAARTRKRTEEPPKKKGKVQAPTSRQVAKGKAKKAKKKASGTWKAGTKAETPSESTTT